MKQKDIKGILFCGTIKFYRRTRRFRTVPLELLCEALFEVPYVVYEVTLSYETKYIAKE